MVARETQNLSKCEERERERYRLRQRWRNKDKHSDRWMVMGYGDREIRDKEMTGLRNGVMDR
jgi:hypothetical protein